MKVAILLDSRRPKVSFKEATAKVRPAGLQVVKDKPDLGLVVGGDGLFSYYGRLKSYPLLFVGYRGLHAQASRAFLAEVEYQQIGHALNLIAIGAFTIRGAPLLQVSLDGKRLGEVFTDVYLERGLEPSCLRYEVSIRAPKESFTDFAVGNGVLVTTSAGSTGYFSHLDKAKTGDRMAPEASTQIGENELGICHILPTYTIRTDSKIHPLRYTVPIESEIEVRLKRDADARLYGVGRATNGYRVTLGQVVAMKLSPRNALLVKLAESGTAKSARA